MTRAEMTAEWGRRTATTIGLLMIAVGVMLCCDARRPVGSRAFLIGPAIALTVVAAAHCWMTDGARRRYALFLGLVWLGIGAVVAYLNGGPSICWYCCYHDYIFTDPTKHQ